MEPDMKREIEEIKALTKDNHRMLRAIRRSQWFGFFTKIAFWAIVLLLPFYFYQQHLVPILDKFSSIPGAATSNILDLPSSADLQKLLESYQAGQ